MNFVEPIRDRKKIAQINNLLRGERRFRDLLLFVVGINTALRISDLLELQVGHFLDDHQHIKPRFWIKDFLPMPDLSKPSESYLSDLFQHDAQNDRYICPQTLFLPLWSQRKSEEMFIEPTQKWVMLLRSKVSAPIDKVKAYQETRANKKASRKQSKWIES